jgi:hypothetical protein
MRQPQIPRLELNQEPCHDRPSHALLSERMAIQRVMLLLVSVLGQCLICCFMCIWRCHYHTLGQCKTPRSASVCHKCTLHLAAGGCRTGSEGFHPGSTRVLLVSRTPILPEELRSSHHTSASCTHSRDNQKRDGGNAGDNSMAIVPCLLMSTSTVPLAKAPLLVIN